MKKIGILITICLFMFSCKTIYKTTELNAVGVIKKIKYKKDGSLIYKIDCHDFKVKYTLDYDMLLKVNDTIIIKSIIN